jgi:hypothetical protein
LGKRAFEIRVELNKIVKTPSQDDVRKVAATLASTQPNIQDLNWNLAVRQYIFDSIKKKL